MKVYLIDRAFLGLLLCVLPGLLYADELSIPMEAQLHYESSVFWLEQGEPEKAYEFLKHAITVCPDYKIAKQKLPEVEKALKKKKLEEERRREEQQRIEAEEQREYRAKILQERQIEQEKKYREQNEAEAEQRRQERSKQICGVCSSDCSVNKYEMDTSCFEACTRQKGVYMDCLNLKVQQMIQSY